MIHAIFQWYFMFYDLTVKPFCLKILYFSRFVKMLDPYLSNPAFQGLMTLNQYRQKSNCVHHLLLYRLSWLSVCSGRPPVIK